MALAATPCDLFRAGKTSGPKFEVRAGEVMTFTHNGEPWVVARSGGVSTLETMRPGMRGPWYRLPAGTPYDDAVFFLHNDRPGHRQWEPAYPMRLADYVAALAGLGAQFVVV